MMKMRDENGNIILNIVYGNNHFEPIDLFNNVSNNMDISTNDVDNDTKNNCTCAMDRNDEQNRHSTKQKKNYLDIPFKQHINTNCKKSSEMDNTRNWISIIHENPHLGLNTT